VVVNVRVLVDVLVLVLVSDGDEDTAIPRGKSDPMSWSRSL